jgi:hypothetical protein
LLAWVIRTLATQLAKTVTLGEYDRIKNENKRARDYGDFIQLMEGIAKTRLPSCTVDEITRDCPSSSVISQYYQEGRTSDGTAPLRIYTIIGSDGQVINVQGFDLSQTIMFTVRHTSGTFDYERLDPTEAMKRIRREAGYRE